MTSSRIFVSMWSGPRNISTTMMRAFENRPDTAVLDEPFYATYLQRTGAEHPHRTDILARYPNAFEGVLDWMAAGAPADEPILFCKHIAYHYPDDWPLDWIAGHRNVLLIRDPRRMMASFNKKYDDPAPVAQSYRVARRILTFLEERGAPCPIIDAADVLAAPGAMLAKLCAALDLPFDDALQAKMLAWPAGRRDSDGPWAAHWYDAVEASTGFKPPRDDPAPALSPEFEAAARASEPDYQALYARRLTA